MGSRSGKSVRFGAPGVVAAIALSATLLTGPAWAQHADAGVETRTLTTPSAASPRPPTEASGAFPKAINPAQLSEGVRASLEERAAARHATSLPVPKADLGHELGAAPAVADGVSPPAARHRFGSDEPLRRGQAHMRRVQAVETDEGVTVLSNRIVTPEPHAAALVARSAERPLRDAPEHAEGAIVNDPSRVTETRSLRPASAQRLEAAGSGIGWLAWPLVLFVTTGAVVGTLWFRKKTN